MKPTNRKLQRAIGARIRTWRKRKGLSMSELARRTRVTPEAISLIENGRRAPSFAMALRICARLKKPLHQLFTPPSSRTMR